ncbi:MAG: hypothetical protein ACFHWX_10730 [Bacteroidota bacterium]
MITDEQVLFIENELNNSAIINKELKDDLVDHMCCLVEINMNKGLTFDQAYQKAFLQTSPNGFDEIQNETLFLLNYNKIMNMKRLLYLSGYLFSTAFILGSFFKMMHWPWANILMYGGITGVACIFAPLLFLNQYKHIWGEVLSERLKWIFGLLTLLLGVAGLWLKLLHLPGAGIALGLSFLAFGFGFLPFLFFRMYKRSVEQL